MIGWPVSIGEDSTIARYEPATSSESGVVFVCAHGAGGHRADAGMTRLARTLRDNGIGVVRFNFIYREQGLRRIDPMPRLTACVAAVTEYARRELAPRLLLLGGRSMGGRAASMLAAEGYACDALILCAYPLHPAGKPEQLRDAHLPKIRVPVLCFNGTRDPLCTPDLMRRTLERVTTPWTVHWLEGADHSFHVLKSSGRTNEEVMNEVGDAAARWLATLKR